MPFGNELVFNGPKTGRQDITRRDHLTRFKAGNPGGPGRPKGGRSASIFAENSPRQMPRFRPKVSSKSWIEQLIKEVNQGKRNRLEIIKFLDGSSPPETIPDLDGDQPMPRIRIPGAWPTRKQRK